MNEALRKLWVRLGNVVTRAVLDRGDSNGRFLQLLWGGSRVSADVEHLEPQGLHFSPAADSSALILAPGGSRAGVVAIGVGGVVPSDDIGPGAGGLHFLGTYKVFLEEDGSLSLGAKEPDDRVACGDKTDARIEQLRSDLTDLKTAIGTGFTAVGAGGAANGPTGKTAFDGASAAIPAAAPTVGSSVVKVQS